MLAKFCQQQQQQQQLRSDIMANSSTEPRLNTWTVQWLIFRRSRQHVHFDLSQ